MRSTYFMLVASSFINHSVGLLGLLKPPDKFCTWGSEPP